MGFMGGGIFLGVILSAGAPGLRAGVEGPLPWHQLMPCKCIFLSIRHFRRQPSAYEIEEAVFCYEADHAAAGGQQILRLRSAASRPHFAQDDKAFLVGAALRMTHR
jgi:hypothetical protein